MSHLVPTEKIWHNGRFIPWDDAKIHVLSHVVNYGSSVFEGIRCYSHAFRPGDLPRCASTCGGWWIRPESTAWTARYTARAA